MLSHSTVLGAMQRYLRQALHAPLLQGHKLETVVIGASVVTVLGATLLMTHAMQLVALAIGESVGLEHGATQPMTDAMQLEPLAIGASVVRGRGATVLMTGAMKLATTRQALVVIQCRGSKRTIVITAVVVADPAVV